MWSYNEENIKKDSRSERLLTSGCYPCTIQKAYIYTSNSTNLEALYINLLTSNGKSFTLKIFYKGRDEKETNFVEQINKLEYLLQLEHQEVTKSVVLEEIYKEEKEVVKAFENKKIGVIVTVEEKEENNEKKYEYKLKDFYELTGKRTAFEISTNQEASSYYYWCKKLDFDDTEEVFKRESEAQFEEKEEEYDDKDDGFPF